MDCANKLSKDIFHDTDLPCGQTKAEGIAKNVLPPKSLQDYTDMLKDPANSSNFFSIGTDASDHKNIYVRWF
jgi:hypothetical protein